MKKGSLQNVQKNPIYIPCQWSSSRYVCPPKEHPGPDHLRLQLATGQVPFPNLQEYRIILEVLEGKRPRKPHPFEARGITLEVWKVAEKCWRQKASKRPEIEKVLRDLEKIANPGTCTHNTLWKSIDFLLKQTNGHHPRLGGPCVASFAEVFISKARL